MNQFSEIYYLKESNGYTALINAFMTEVVII